MKKLISVNPANLNIVGEVEATTHEFILHKVKQAHQAKREWKNLGIKNRTLLLEKTLSAFKKREQELTLLTVQEVGKPITEVLEDLAADFSYFQDFLTKGPEYIADEITLNDNKNHHRIVYEPRGVVACIVPWNFPFTNFVWSVIPNLIVGNVVIFKHSEECPLIGKLIEEVMEEINLPPGVFTEIYGDGEEGEFLVDQDIDFIWFIGSSLVGRKLYNIAGRKQIKAILEMGGSNPAIVFEDVDIDNVIPKIYRGRFTNCGQICDAIKRLIVHESIVNDVIEKMANYLNQLKVGDPFLKETDIGPLVAMRQLELLEGQLQDSINLGAKVITGGKRLSHLKGVYFAPTLVTNVARNMRIWEEEVFGPLLPVMSFATEEEAIDLANDTLYGLGSVVYSKDKERAQRVANALEAGFVDINEGSHWQPSNPFGGYKQSGMGYEHGRLGFQELCRYKVIAEA